jgi:hypothetical protein
MRFSHDRRGQSVVIGTVILFGFLILALSLYQVQVVPQQNAQTEFEHFEEVRNDLVELRAGILQAGSVDQPQYQTVRLGTTYSTRIFAINPPDPAGTIRTSEPYNITITSDDTGDTLNISTRFIEYRPGYNELDQPLTRYDASVLYLDGRDQGDDVAVIEDQELVRNGEVRIVAIQNEFRRSGTGQVTLELRPTQTVTQNLPTGNLSITIPTRLNETEWETKTDLPTSSDVYGGVSANANGVGVYNLTLNTTADDLTVDTVGVQEAPEDPVQNENAQVGGDDTVVDEQKDAIRYNNDPSILSVSGKGNNQVDAGVQFSVTNERSQSVQLSSVVIESSTGGSADGLRNGTGNGQTVISASSGSPAEIYEADNKGYEFGEVGVLSSPLYIVPGNKATISLTYFAEEKNNGQITGDYVDIRGETIRVQLNFSDGSEKTINVVVPS